jgi:hypothetical protein
MSGLWEPADKLEITIDKLNQYVDLMSEVDETDLSAAMTDEMISGDVVLMKQQESSWEAAQELTDDSLVKLIRFFTLAEMQLAGWDGGRQSPVIYLASILKSRGRFEQGLRKWIKKNSDNRYLPYGSAL